MKNSIHSLLLLIGLTESQALLYEALVNSEGMRVQQLVAVLQIPRSTVYEHIRALGQMGLILEVQDGARKKIVARPISALSGKLEEDAARTNQQLISIKELERALSVKTMEPSNMLTSVFYDTNNAGSLLDHAGRAHHELRVFCTYNEDVQKLLLSALRRGVDVKVLVNPKQVVLERILRSDHTHLGRIRAIDMSALDIQSETFLYDDTYAQLHTEEGKTVGFEITSPDLALQQRALFDALWLTARAVTSYF